MKILQVIPSLNPELGGPTQVAICLTKALQSAGATVEIVTTDDCGNERLKVPLNRKIEYEGVPVWFLPRFSPPLKEFIFSPAITQWFVNNIRNYDISDNHYLFSYAPSCAAAIARFYNIPYTVRTMGQLSPWALAQSRKKKQIYMRLIEGRNLEKAAAIHCTSSGEEQDVRNFGLMNPTITLPLGVPVPPRFPEASDKVRDRYQLPRDVPLLLFLSRLHYKKRPDLLLEALSSLPKEQKFHLIFAGTGEADYVEELQALVEALDLKSCVSFIGFASGEEKDILLQGCDVFILPSYADNFAIAVAEAMAAGLPVIITQGIQIAPDIVQAEAGIVVEGEVEALKRAIAQLLTSPTQRAKMGDNGRNWARGRYSWEANATQLIPIYERIIQKKL
ncbi:glycosyltransferase [Oscillatoria sp. FACHB-1406]|uniref:glycosyltransferase n=1 Tax=Oscillatoria sp. FACHB-1406 TaxID=2692846 RepID=UPI0016844101|nr:glycosyltransferase [Oscillatoria sp. FACHB-1406]